MSEGCKGRKVYPDTPDEGWVGIFPVGKGRPMHEVRDTAGKRLVFETEDMAEQAAVEAFRNYLLGNHDTTACAPSQPTEDNDR